MSLNDIRSKNDEVVNTEESDNENSISFDENVTSVEDDNKENQWASPTEPSQRSRDHHIHDYCQDTKNNIYRIRSTDMWDAKYVTLEATNGSCNSTNVKG